MNDIPAAVEWSEGMLLAPQHLQRAFRHQDALLAYHASAISPYHWGLIAAGARKLDDGVLTLGGVEAVLPDGSVVRCGGSIDVKPYAARTQPVTIHLAVPERQPGRYAVDEEEVLDECSTDESGKLKMTVLRPLAQLVVDVPEGSSSFPIAKVTWDGGAIVEVPYEPPWLVVRGGSAIHKLCGAVADELRRKAEPLAASIESESESSRGLELLETRMLIHSLVAALPPLEVLLSSKAAHPFALYLALASIAGNLAPGSVPARIVPYQHNDLWTVFTALQAAIGDALVKSIHEPYTVHPFRLMENSFRLRIEPKWLGRRMLLRVRAAEGAKPADVDEWVVQSTIGAASVIDTLSRRRVLGVGRVSRHDSGMLPESGYVYYELDANDDLLLASDDLVITSHDRDRRPAEVVLYVDTED